jgi:hypothetical protein
MTWNFANLVNTGNSSESYIACSAAPSCAIMTGTNMVGTNSSTYAYYISSSTKFSMRGMEASGVTFDYSDPEEMVHFPFSTGNNYVDSFTTSYVSSGLPMVRKGYVVVNADAWGTLITPSGTFNNVLRIHRVKHFTDYYSGNPLMNSFEGQYYWIQPGNHEFILFCDSLDYGTGYTTTSFYTDLTPVNDINEVNSTVNTISIAPLPANERLNVRFLHGEEGNVGFSITDMLGREAKTIPPSNYSKGENSISIDIVGLPAGIYLFNINDGLNIVSRKIEVY